MHKFKNKTTRYILSSYLGHIWVHITVLYDNSFFYSQGIYVVFRSTVLRPSWPLLLNKAYVVKWLKRFFYGFLRKIRLRIEQILWISYKIVNYWEWDWELFLHHHRTESIVKNETFCKKICSTG